MFRKLAISAAALFLAFAAGCKSGPDTAATADTIYYGGDIVTVNDAQPTAEAIAVKDGKILMLGSRAEVETMHKGGTTQEIDLGGKTLLPGFVDPHSHFLDSMAASQRVNVSAPPAGPASNPEEIIAEIKKLAAAKETGELLVAYGYDENQMPKGHPLTRDQLDKAFPDYPVVVLHVSGHGAVLNSLAFAKFGYKDGMPTPAGGVINRKPGTQILEGLVMETAFLPVYSNMPKIAPDQEVAQAKAGQMIYAAAGVTTAQEGLTQSGGVLTLKRLANQKALFIDVVSYPFGMELDKILATTPVSQFGTYNNHLKFAGCKLTLDGSPQGKTAFFTTPYLTGGPGGQKNWKGEPTIPQDEANAIAKKCYDNNLQLLMHANGDAAIDTALKAHEYAAAGSLDKDRRTVIIHAQFVRQDQLQQFAKYKIIPSLFTEHVFYFGDTHILNRGLKQASFISPLRAAFDLGLHPTNHTDYSIVPIDQMMTMSTAVNRVTRSGVLLGPDQRVTSMEALKAITINAAYQYREENSKGSLEAGKLADLVILDKNPLKVDPMTIKDIKVLETIKEGKTIYKAD